MAPAGRLRHRVPTPEVALAAPRGCVSHWRSASRPRRIVRSTLVAARHCVSRWRGGGGSPRCAYPLRWAAACCAAVAMAYGCLPKPESVAAPQAPPRRTAGKTTPAESPIRFENGARAAGISFTLGHGGRSPLTILETAGGGCAFLDYDQDGWPDILLVGPHRLALYHNERNGCFRDVTAQSGMATDRYWMGCAIGDYDGDGRPDIFLTGYRCCALYRNLGGGRF